jgi:hypothetical protein
VTETEKWETGSGVSGRSSNTMSIAFGHPNAPVSEASFGASRIVVSKNWRASVAANSGPTDEQLQAEISRIIATSDLMKLTKKQVREELAQVFGMDMKSRKEMINATIDKILSRQSK